ncbi:MAG TPA: hypothetical protein P5120_13585 [Spirochaetota bacterium]|mgnify:CR=1 FL=1|nr:hypothetical protein [Spirochaetota bacterium]HPF07176.1 hypothetical protein [Spirochaetota bacterium]HPJ41611.1 hypothetical protein [Spirochaetota bacterium]HPR36718.1 hypothetical protein [Spirochaetota bacterium]HRX48545.1 hypothetical protein [Spirochaetota bacterium]
MKFIIDCPLCSKSLRFPIDKGKIKIKCSCGYEVVIDPDDTSLYKKGRFDLKPDDSSKKKKPVKKTGSLFDKDKIIRKLFDYRYTLQNLRYMPDREKYRMLLLIILPVLLLIIIIYAFYGLFIK